MSRGCEEMRVNNKNFSIVSLLDKVLNLYIDEEHCDDIAYTFRDFGEIKEISEEDFLEIMYYNNDKYRKGSFYFMEDNFRQRATSLSCAQEYLELTPRNRVL